MQRRTCGQLRVAPLPRTPETLVVLAQDLSVAVQTVCAMQSVQMPVQQLHLLQNCVSTSVFNWIPRIYAFLPWPLHPRPSPTNWVPTHVCLLPPSPPTLLAVVGRSLYGTMPSRIQMLLARVQCGLNIAAVSL